MANAKKFRPVLGVLTLLTVWAVALSGGYLLASAALRRWAPDANGYMLTMAAGMTGFLIASLGALVVGRLAQPKRNSLLLQVKEAMERIARGDYDVSLQHLAGDGAFGNIIESFHAMAGDLKRMEQLRQQFVSDVSHEIQSPLTSIGGFAQVLRTGEPSEEERQRYLAIIETESRRLSALGDSLLRLNSLDSGHHPFEPVSYRLDRQLRSAILSLEPQWLEKGLTVRAELPELQAAADEVLMQQVWINLLANSIKFTPPGGEIAVTGERSGGEVRVRIADTGIGMTPDDLPRVFERFFKADRSRNRTHGGSGLGLSIVSRIVERHGGKVEAASEPGEGTVMTVVLPVG